MTRVGSVMRDTAPCAGNSVQIFLCTRFLSVDDEKYRPVSSVAKRTLLEWEVRGSTPRPVKSAQCRQRLATATMFLRSCVA